MKIENHILNPKHTIKLFGEMKNKNVITWTQMFDENIISIINIKCKKWKFVDEIIIRDINGNIVSQEIGKNLKNNYKI